MNGDGVVDASDLFDLGKAYGSTSSSPNWNQNCDFNKDHVVDVLDLSALSKNYEKITNKDRDRRQILARNKKRGEVAGDVSC